MSAFDKFKQKIKQANIPGQLKQIINDPTNPYFQDQIKPVEEEPQKQVVTFSLETMDQFSHEELQQVIKKYDGEYKRIKKQGLGKTIKIYWFRGEC